MSIKYWLWTDSVQQSSCKTNLRSEIQSVFPFFSVVITTYKRPDFLKRALESVVRQDFSDFEIWVIDDDPAGADTGGVDAVVEQYSNPAIRLVRHPQNRGTSGARNTGLQVARGQYIVFLDDDDEIAPTFLSRAYGALCNAPKSVGFAFVGRKVFQWDGEKYVVINEYAFNYQGEVVLPGKTYLERTIGGGSGLILSAECARTIQHFNTDLAAEEDIEFLLRAALHFDYLVISDYLHFVYNHPAPQATKNLRKVVEGKEYITNTYHSHFSDRVLAVRYRHTARLYAMLGETSASRGAMKRALRHAPLDYRNWAFLVLLELKDFLPTGLHEWFFMSNRQRHNASVGGRVKTT